MFVLESTYDGAGTIVETLLMKNNEAATAGETFKFDTGRLTEASGSDKPVYVGIQTVTLGTDKPVEVIAVRPDQVWVADYVTSSTNAPAIGATHCIDGDGLNVDADTTADANSVAGKVFIISVDTAKKKCRCKFVG